ncbi:hypothetical protein [Embleya sp. NPDC050493]|uniref:hypothetical protein n=1 Tax=Embleya sp. NPDC050493 TaxID=3363989 RepID=UPI0037A6F5FD
MSDHFTADGDITATATAVLALAGRPTDTTALDRFRHEDHYYTYPNELQPSLTTTAHALHAHALHAPTTHRPPAPTEPALGFLRNRQDTHGRWTGDKWHTSWIYTTAQVVTALPTDPATPHAIRALLDAQHPDGGWGAHRHAGAGETGYAVLALHRVDNPPDATAKALARAGRWLTSWQESGDACDCLLWTGKEPYCPRRVDRIVALAALLTTTRHTRTRNPNPAHR